MALSGVLHRRNLPPAAPTRYRASYMALGAHKYLFPERLSAPLHGASGRGSPIRLRDASKSTYGQHRRRRPPPGAPASYCTWGPPFVSRAHCSKAMERGGGHPSARRRRKRTYGQHICRRRPHPGTGHLAQGPLRWAEPGALTRPVSSGPLRAFGLSAAAAGGARQRENARQGLGRIPPCHGGWPNGSTDPNGFFFAYHEHTRRICGVRP